MNGAAPRAPLAVQIGEVLLAARKRAGLTMREVRERTGVSASSLSVIENGNGLPGLVAAVRLASLYDIPLYKLAGLVPDHEPTGKTP